MRPENLKTRFGNDIVLWGGAYDPQLISNGLSYDEVYEAVSQNIEILGAGGNYIFAGVHNLPATMSTEHIKAMMDAYYDTRNY